MLHLCLIVPHWSSSCVSTKRWTQPTCPMSRELAYSSIHRRCSKSAISESNVPAMAPLCPLDFLTRMQNCRCSVCLGLMSHPGWNPVGSVPMGWRWSPSMLILIAPWDLLPPVEWVVPVIRLKECHLFIIHLGLFKALHASPSGDSTQHMERQREIKAHCMIS